MPITEPKNEPVKDYLPGSEEINLLNTVLAVYHQAGPKEVAMAIEAAMDSKQAWMDFEWSQRASIFLKMAAKTMSSCTIRQTLT